eukprot:TRINITY_DN18380_c0_g1_i1.p1 TRINITY_DN18380_c0_g1~~TRINITY_DN18380_c0_g1_i1.p1  ORF type:complete len:236 (+),score=27.51 TRINITY_DN18380_c0_g1_i1:49-756(+)
MADETTIDIDQLKPTDLNFLSHDFGNQQQSPPHTSLPTPKIPSLVESQLSKKGFGWLLEVEDSDEYSPPLLEELDIDLREIANKIRCVLLPFNLKDRDLMLEKPDFWGPMAIVLFYSILLIWGQFKVISWVMTVWLIGSFLIFLLARVLGANVTYSQSLGVIGYSLLPLIFTVGLLSLTTLPVLDWIIRMSGTVWAASSAGMILVSSNELRNKRFLLGYPILLLYVYFISLHSGV